MVACAPGIPVLYAAFSHRLREVRWFEEVPELAQALAIDLEQVDADGIRRAYRRVDAIWWAYLCNRTQGPDAAALRARLVAIRGEETVKRAEQLAISNDYLPPRITR